MRRVAWFTALSLATILGVLVLWQIRAGVVLFLVSLAIAAAMRLPIDFLIDRRLPRALAVLLTYLLVFGSIVLLFYLAAGPLGSELQSATDRASLAYDRMQKQWPEGNAVQRLVAESLPPLDVFFRGIAGPEGGGLFGNVLGVGASLAQTISNVGLAIALSIYWIAGRSQFERLWLSLLPPAPRSRARAIWRAIEEGVGSYIRSETVQALLASLFLYLGYLFLDVRYPVILALFGALAWLVPLVGGVLAAIAVVLGGAGQDLSLVVVAVVFTLLVFFFLDLAVEPRLYNRKRYSPILIVLLMIALADVLGLLGIILAPAIAVTIQIFFRELWRPTAERTNAVPRGALHELRQRLTELQAGIAEREVDLEPSTVNLLERLEKLMAEAERALPAADDAAAPAVPLPYGAPASLPPDTPARPGSD